MTARTILDTPGVVVTLDETAGLVRLTRTSTPTNLDEIRKLVDRLDDAIPIGTRAGLALFQDMRDAPLVNTPEMEAEMAPLLQRLTRGFAARAILVRTAVGKLQATRSTREMSLPAGVFHDEAEALAFLRERRKP